MKLHYSPKLYSWGSQTEVDTLLQAERTARLPIVHDHLSLMPDAHIGMGATIGSVIPTKGAIIPAAVGVDIGCGMIAVKTDIASRELPDDLNWLLGAIGKAVPAGVGNGRPASSRRVDQWLTTHKPRTDIKDYAAKAATQLGSLGAGNHFIEICLDESELVWVVLHSGSRGIGNILAKQHIALARAQNQALEDKDLAYFLQTQPEFDHYIADMLWAQDYALFNRELMMDAVLTEVFAEVGRGGERQRINCHHNFAQIENHDGEELWITRKGAIEAQQGQYGVIPGSMGTETYIIKGTGEPDSWRSCSHGAGRLMSRSKAKKSHSTEELEEMMKGKTWLHKSAKGLLDEIPTAYKPIKQVMADQSDLVEIQHELTQILNYKGTK